MVEQASGLTDHQVSPVNTDHLVGEVDEHRGSRAVIVCQVVS